MFCPALGLLAFVVSLCSVGCQVVGCQVVFENGFRGAWGSIGSGRAHKPHTPRAGAKKYIRGELDKGMVFGDMRETKFLSSGWMGIWEVGHGRVSRGVLQT